MAVELQPSKTVTITSQSEFLVRAVILAIALLLLSRNVTGLFVSWHEANSALYSYFARNHIQYGLGYTKLFNTRGDTLTPPAEPNRYLNHPPLLTLWTAIPMLVFGDHEWVGRSVPIVTTLASAWLLMIIVSRLQSPLLGLLSGFFYVTLPVTAYFGRMLDHTSPVQFFSLLMLHGYLQWAGLYGNGYRRTPGAVYYALGAVLGIGTGWAAVIMAGLIWLWHICRMFRDSSVWPLLFWLTLIPAASLAAVIIHILWGCHWDRSMLIQLLLSRMDNSQNPLPWTGWFVANWAYLGANVSVLGVGAAVIYMVIIAVVLQRTASDSPFRQIVRNRTSVMPILLTALQGLIWVFAFKRQSWIHIYWQYLTAPFFAVAMAAVVLTVFTLLVRLRVRMAMLVVSVLVLLPMSFFMDSLDMLHQPYLSQDMRDIFTVFKELEKLVPLRAPVMIREEYPQFSESFGSYTSYWTLSEIAYYANRPLIHSTDFGEIQANRQGCAAYVIQLTNDPNSVGLARQLNEKYKLAWARKNFLIFLLNQPPKDN